MNADTLIEILEPYRSKGYEICFHNCDTNLVEDCLRVKSVRVIPATDAKEEADSLGPCIILE